MFFIDFFEAVHIMLMKSRVSAILGRRMHQELVSEWRIQVYPSRVSIHAHKALIARRTIHLKSGAAQCCALYTRLIDQRGDRRFGSHFVMDHYLPNTRSR